ncbi:carboxylesterase/lipase family protein [Dongia sp.]|uniref:carboxylesterase/lipase family protein n=1 Tax=Dongia sp. TaxID=1977262 RepID=UPI0035AF8CA9
MTDRDSAQRPVVETRSGPVQGITDARTGQQLFLGIPYAEPPLGKLRFRPPRAKEPWRAPLDCSRFGAAGTQIFDPTEGAYEEFTGSPADGAPARWVGSEDCLTLNIWRRPNGASGKPVLVWIHGGANWLESSRLEIYHGDRFVDAQDVIFVSINYRLGIFGWLELSGLGGADYRGSHSNGLRDQILALEWIRDNIAAFGGDPMNITVMGESAGSIDISWHLAAGRLAGIARRVIMMSGVAGLPGMTAPLPHEWSETHGLTQANCFLARLGVTTMAELTALSTADIMNRLVEVAAASDTLFEMDALFWPRVSSSYAPVDPFTAARHGHVTGIDVMIGCTDYEMGLWLNWDATLDQHPVRWTAERLPALTPEQRKSVCALYDSWFAHDTEGSRGLHLLGDLLFRLPSIWFADEAAGQGSNVWTFLFDWSVDDRRRAQHAADQAFLFKKWETSAGRHLLGDEMPADDARRRDRTAAAMMDAILSFATGGNPNGDGVDNLPTWPRYDKAQRAVMCFGRDIRVVADPAGPRRQWWTETIYRQITAGK